MLSSQESPSLLSVLQSSSQIKSRIAGFKIPRLADGQDTGALTLGGVDQTKFDPNYMVTMNNTGKGYWKATVDSVSVDSKTLQLQLAGPRIAILDTGTVCF